MTPTSLPANNTKRLQKSAIAVGLLAVLWCFVPAHGQELSRWSSHTPFRSVRSIAASAEAIWAATSGGVFSYSIADNVVQTYTSTSGLYGIDANAIGYDEGRDAVWVGYSDGVLDRIDVVSGSVQTFLDIQRADQFATRGINRLRVVGDTVFVATDFGLVLFDPVKLEVRDSFSKLGSLEPATRTYDVLVAPAPDGQRAIWVATAAGLARAPVSTINLREPSAWTIEDGIPVDEVLALGERNGQIFAGTTADAYAKLSSGSWQRLFVSGGPVYDFVAWNQYVVAVESFAIALIGTDLTATRIGIGYGDGASEIPYISPRSVVTDADGSVWVADTREGLLGLPGLPTTASEYRSDLRVLPNGPFFGLFTDLVVDRDGALWASGTPGAGTGFYKFQNNEWTTYAGRFVPELEGRDTYDFIHADQNGQVWAGSSGYGAAEVDAEGAVSTYDMDNSTLRPAPGTGNYVRVRGITSESDGNVWMINEFVATPLNGRLPDGTWFALAPLRGDGLSTSMSYDKIFVDGFDQKWILPLLSEGIIVWSTEGTPTDGSDDRVKYIRGRGSAGRGLPDENVRAWAEDRAGRVWIGTERGIATFFIPSLVISNDPNAYEPVWPIAEDRSGFLLRDLFVNDIAVDAADRKWIASTTGAWLIDPDGTVVLKHFDTSNSPLFSDEVVAVAVNNLDGRVYFATETGLLSYQEDPVEPAADANDLFVFPNPVRAHADGSLPPIFIEGLVAETDVRVTSPDGTLIAKLDGRGGRTRWDGRDLHGEFVPSGVYIVIGLGLNGEGAGVGKIAVLR